MKEDNTTTRLSPPLKKEYRVDPPIWSSVPFFGLIFDSVAYVNKRISYLGGFDGNNKKITAQWNQRVHPSRNLPGFVEYHYTAPDKKESILYLVAQTIISPPLIYSICKGLESLLK